MKALVYVAAFAPEAGESAIDLSEKFPGSTSGPTPADPVALPDGGLLYRADEVPQTIRGRPAP